MRSLPFRPRSQFAEAARERRLRGLEPRLPIRDAFPQERQKFPLTGRVGQKHDRLRQPRMLCVSAREACPIKPIGKRPHSEPAADRFLLENTGRRGGFDAIGGQ